MNIFDIIGPVMIGPSSSHTAGAARIGKVAGKLLGSPVRKAEILLHGSFAKTYVGHGTDRAIIGGLLGFDPDDARLTDSFSIAESVGLEFEFKPADLGHVHPNTARLNLTSESGEQVCITASSVGGGVISIIRIDDAEVNFAADLPTTVIFNEDKAGVVAHVSGILATEGINIAFMRLFRKNGHSIMVIETDQSIGNDVIEKLRAQDHVNKVIEVEV